ncbi:MAG: hypothetical protein HY335_02310 [Deinococcus sp.]|nr:hypothetical protein [Deinococcus sp.]
MNLGFTLLFGESFGHHSTAAMNLLSAMLGIGSFCGPLAIALFLPHNAVWAFFVPAVVSVTLIGLGSRLPITDRAERPSPPAALGTSSSWILVGFLLLFFIYVGREAGTGSWEATHLAPIQGETSAALFTSLFWGAIVLGRLVAVPLSLRVRAPRLVVSAALASCTLFALSHHPALAPYTYLLAGFTLAPIFPTSLAWLRQTLPGRVTQATALVLVSAGLGGVVFPPLIGLLVETWSQMVIPTALTAIAFACLVVASVLAYATAR